MPATPKTTIKDLFKTRSKPYELPLYAEAKSRVEKSVTAVGELVKKVDGQARLVTDLREIDKLQQKELVGILKATLPILGTLSSSLGDIQGSLSGVPALFDELERHEEELEAVKGRLDEVEETAQSAHNLAETPTVGGANAPAIVQALFGNAEFANLVREIVAADVGQAGPIQAQQAAVPGSPSKAARKAKATVLQAHCHHAVKLLVGMESAIVKGSTALKNAGSTPNVFPKPLATGKQQTLQTFADGKRKVWCPDWKNVRKPEWEEFREAVIAVVLGNWDQHDLGERLPNRTEIVACTVKYCRGLAAKAGKPPADSSKGGVERKSWSDKVELKTVKDRKKTWDQSILRDVQKTSVWRRLLQRCFVPSFYKADDEEDMRYPDPIDPLDLPADGDEPGGDVEVSAWHVYRRSMLGPERCRIAIEICWPTWMSNKAIIAASVLDFKFAVTQEGKQSAWQPRWCGPREYWPQTDLKLSELAPPLADNVNVLDESNETLYVIYWSMVRPDVLASIQENLPEIYARLYPDPVPTPNDAARMTLEAKLNQGSNLVIRQGIAPYVSKDEDEALPEATIRELAIEQYYQNTGIQCT